MSLADLASLASSIAVLVSLLFLALQVRQSNRNQRSLMQQGRLKGVRSGYFQSIGLAD